MKGCPTCRPVKCLTFGDFTIVNPTDTLYQNVAQNLLVNCPNGTTPFVTIPAGVIGYVLNFAIGQPPYPALTLNCTGGTITIPVPDDATQDALVALITDMLNQCAAQIALQIGCASTTYLNTLQQFQPACRSSGDLIYASGGQATSGVPSGVTIDPTLNFILVAPGTITSSVSQADANGKALQLAQEAFNSRQIICAGSS